MERNVANNKRTGPVLEEEGDSAGTNTCLKIRESPGDLAMSTVDKMIMEFFM